MTQIAKNYADALYDLAKDEALEEELLPQLSWTADLFARTPDYISLLCAANISRDERLNALDEAFSGRVHPYLLSFLKLLCERRHVRELPGCARRYRNRFNEDRGILEARAVTAVPLSKELRGRLIDRLHSLTGKQIDLEERIDPDVLGGVRLEYEGKELDGTVRCHLEGLKKTLSEIVL